MLYTVSLESICGLVGLVSVLYIPTSSNCWHIYENRKMPHCATVEAEPPSRLYFEELVGTKFGIRTECVFTNK